MARGVGGTMKRGSAAACAHCGLPVDRAETEVAPSGPVFCCHGCARVYALLHEQGLADYYRVRGALGTTPNSPVPEAARSRGDYLHLDEPATRERIGDAPGHARLQLTGLSCPACVWLIERLPDRIDGFESARVNLGRGSVDLRFDPARIELSAIASTLDGLGYASHVESAAAQRAQAKERRRELIRLAVVGACAGNVMLLSFGLHAGSLQGIEARFAQLLELAALGFSIPVVTYGAWPFYRGVLSGLRHGRLHLDLPISLGIVASFVASLVTTIGRWVGLEHDGAVAALGSYYDSVTALVFLLLVGRWLQARGQRWAMSRWDLTQRLLPQNAWRRDDDCDFVAVATTRLIAGDVIRVRPGELVPADAVVTEGRAAVDRAALTGESRGDPVALGDRVLAGSRVTSGQLHARLVCSTAESQIGQLANTISGAGHLRAPLQRRVDRLAGAFTLAVLAIATAAGVVWTQLDPSRTFDVVVAILVVSCPCALGIATPMALTVARARAAQRGLAIRSDANFEALAKVRHILFDKTGTLTRGRAVVLSATPGLEKHAALVAALEAHAAHPMATALRAWARSHLGTRPTITCPRAAVAELAGQGIEGIVVADGIEHRVRIGRPQWLLEGAQSFSAHAEVRAAVDAGHSPVLLEVDGEIRGTFGIGDPLRPHARATLRALQDRGLTLSIASGDHPQLVARLARELGIEGRGGMSPQAKIDEVRARRPVAMVGDGINDAAAMRAAEVGIAVEGASDLAGCIADVQSVGGHGLALLPELIDGARATMRVVRRNLSVSLAYNVLFVGAAVLGWINPLVAAIGMPLSSLSVIALSTVGGGFRGRKARTSAQTMPARAAAFAGDESPLVPEAT